MNCRRIEELIPLYIEGDLDERSAGAVQLHLQSCEACCARRAEYEASQAWLRAYELPDFDEAFVDSVRLNVMRELAARGDAPPFVERLKRWLTPRRLAVVTAALIVIFVALALFMYSTRSRVNQGSNEQAGNPPVPNVEKTPDDLKPAPGAKLATDHQPKRRTPHRAVPVFAKHLRRNVQRADKPQDHLMAQRPLDAIPVRPANDSLPATYSEERLRIEFQTADPNIRIIWFAPKQTGDAPNPMGETR